MAEEGQSTGSIPPPKIRRGPLDSLSVYEITDYELELLARGAPASVFLTFATLCLSIGGSFLTVLLSVDIPSVKMFAVFVVVSILGLVVGLVLLVLWYRSHKSVSETVSKIEGRMKPEPTSGTAEKPPGG